jgi:class 3 adenylate cyclase
MAESQSAVLLIACVQLEPLMAERVQRRLAAVLAADVFGYSRLMGTEEVGTLAALKSLRREVVDPAITAHHAFKEAARLDETYAAALRDAGVPE